MEKLKLLIIIPKRKPDFPETGIENDTIFKDLPGDFAKPSQKPQKEGLRPQWLDFDLKKNRQNHRYPFSRIHFHSPRCGW
jgi:hypothetical protein